MLRPYLLAAAVAVLMPLAADEARADFIIEVNYSGDEQYRSAFEDAAAVWEGLLSGYQDGVVANRSFRSSYQLGDRVERLYIDAAIAPNDGAGGVLGFAGWRELVIDNAGYYLATDGIMSFDSADVGSLFASGSLSAVILHEMAHVMGFGTLWTVNQLYTNNSGEFRGTNATAAWQEEFGQIGTPNVELGGGGGTANGHWNEVNGGAGFTGLVVTDPTSPYFGQDMRYELMTGWLNDDLLGDPFISRMTIASFEDIGFVAANVAAVPEPSSLMLIGIAAGGAFKLRRKRRPADGATAA